MAKLVQQTYKKCTTNRTVEFERNKERIAILLVDTVSADKKHDEVEGNDRPERRHSAVCVDTVVHYIVPVFACQYLYTQSIDHYNSEPNASMIENTE